MKYTKLASQVLDLGRDVLKVAAHPTRPWLAVHRGRPGREYTIDHVDCLTSTTLSSNEYHGVAVSLEWVGDRMVLLCTAEDEHLRIEEGGNLDVVYLPGVHRPLGSTPTRHGWGVEYSHYVYGEIVATMLSRVGGRLDVRQTPADRGASCWHPDGAVFARLRTSGASSGVEFVESDAIVHVALPEPWSPHSARLLGWVGPDQLLVYHGVRFSRASRATLWSLVPSSRQWTALASAQQTSAMTLSPDGTLVAWVTRWPLYDGNRVLLMDATSGTPLHEQSILPLDVDPPLHWIGPQTLLISSSASPFQFELVDPSGSRGRFTVRRGGVRETTHVEVFPVASHHLLFTRTTRRGRPILTDDVVW